MEHKILCNNCGKEFEGYNRKYCSSLCYHNSRKGLKRPSHSKIMKENYFKNNVGSYFNNKGIKLNKKQRKNISDRMKNQWKNLNSSYNQNEYRQKLSDHFVNLNKQGKLNKGFSNCYHGWYKINGEREIYFRSKWEANYALYLDFLKNKKEIKDWFYEKKTFWFEEIKRGVRSYKPDFQIINNDGTIEYHEVKGWMDSKSKTKIKRLKKYYPDVKLIIIDKESYNDIYKKLGGLLNFY